MKTITQHLVVSIIAIAGFIAVMGIAGTYDYADQVVYTMPDATYQAITKRIGKASNVKVAKEYMSNKAYYDTFK